MTDTVCELTAAMYKVGGTQARQMKRKALKEGNTSDAILWEYTADRLSRLAKETAKTCRRS